MKTLTLFAWIGRHRWDRIAWYFLKDPIYDSDSESFRAENSDFMSIGQPKNMEVCHALFSIDQHPYIFNKEESLLLHKGHSS
jgi:hypothetical protein